MGILFEEKALEHNNIPCMDSLEEKLSVFFGEDFDQSDRSFEGGEEYESKTNDLQEPEERTLYWETQQTLVQEIVENYSLTASKLRQEISKIIKVAKERDFCKCAKPQFDGCIHCLRRVVVNLLCDKGFKATLCTSRWTHTKKFPGGTHEYIQVTATTNTRKKQIPFLIELEFRDQFKIAKACNEYHKLVNQLPEYYIGKPDYLNAIVRVVCDSAKRSMKEKKIHMGPWRKRSFMQMKWSGSNEKRSKIDESLDELPSFSIRQASESCLHFTVVAPAAVVVT